jgi:ketosteroid isomerase-like protein
MSSDALARRLLAHVAQSPQRCAAHDKDGWLALFADDAEINDPVGSRPHRGRREIGNFYETFIAPNRLRFDVEHDIVVGMTVMRDLTLTSTMATGLAIPVPMHLRYDLSDDAGVLKIRRLFAHWELREMLSQQMASLDGIRTSFQLTPRMLRYQGVAGVLGFMRGLGGHGPAGRATASTVLAAFAAGDVRAAGAFLAADCAVEVPSGHTGTADELAATLRNMQWRKLIGAGDFVSATVQVGARRGVVVLRFTAPARITGLQLVI